MGVRNLVACGHVRSLLISGRMMVRIGTPIAALNRSPQSSCQLPSLCLPPGQRLGTGTGTGQGGSNTLSEWVVLPTLLREHEIGHIQVPLALDGARLARQM